MELFTLTERPQKRFRMTACSDCDVTIEIVTSWTFLNTIYFVTMRLPFNATCGGVASWRNDQTDWKQAFAKFIDFSSLNHLGRHKKIWGALPLNHQYVRCDSGKQLPPFILKEEGCLLFGANTSAVTPFFSEIPQR